MSHLISLFSAREFASERLFERLCSLLFSLLFLGLCAGAVHEAKADSQYSAATNFAASLAPKVTEIAELLQLNNDERRIDCPIHLEGIVLWVSPKRDMLGLKDNSGVAVIEMEVPGESVRPQMNIIVEGICTVEGERLSLRRRPLVNNEGIHGMIELSGAIFLKAGKHSIHVPWYNHMPPCGLEVSYQGPGMTRQKIPDSALLLPVTTAEGSIRWTSGLNYRAYEGEWSAVPDWSQSEVVAKGVATNFDCSLATRNTNAGLDFTGYLEVPHEGVYTFYLRSDDGSLLTIDDASPRTEVIGTGQWPEPSKISARQHLPPAQQNQWSTVEGTVIFASEQSGTLELELSSGSGRLRVEVAESSGTPAATFLNRRIRATGIARNTYTTDGQRVAGKLLTPGLKQIEVLDAVAENHGQLRPNSAPLPLLATIEEIKHLSREEAQRGYPVKIRGVVTALRREGIFVQDSTWSIYVRMFDLVGGERPRTGDYWEIEGTTYNEFAPNIQARRAVRLGPGTLPEPVRPSWDQLINGSLDTQYMEVQGIATAVETDGMVLLTRAGKIQIRLPEAGLQSIKQYENALIRVRGCVIPARDITTQQIEVGRMDLCNVAITVDEPAPADPFSIPLKSARDLFLFDPRAGALQRVKLSGQILHQRGEELFLADGTNGFRATFIPKVQTRVAVGDRVEVVGFPELGGPTPVLREPLVRVTGHSPLPGPIILPPNAPIRGQYDSTLVKIESRLASISIERADQVLVLQSGAKGFVARLQTRLGRLQDLQPGTRIELTGVYAGQGDRGSGQDTDSFELLLNSPSDVRVLERPSWWTLQRTMVVVGAMAAMICVALVWITLLRRQVEERSQQLTTEMRRHEHTERQRELEQERARIARDLHDDLGAALTQIRFLSALESRDGTVPETTRGRMARVSEKSHELVTSLDEIVWAVNPANDSLPSLATYLCQFAEEFFRATPIRCRLDVDDFLPSVPLTSEVRHNLYLGVREALNNIAKHSQASEVWLRIQGDSQRLRILVEDNGVGLLVPSTVATGEGLANMRRRLESIGGRFECEARVEGGTVCRFELPLKSAEIRP
ncbi:ATP-binding protein [Pedosphaera parvula]|uniref:Histidine kinase n=1 Tax=Pedosphaera parvula (strain Ellin514) TaxID=320771 RepID=B9XIM8_PEDPL|nr:ATP-binding protein [Pedosphaera parvula]EEF60291.1 histidine kinase [Pedosphaera parvula Ellin514]